MKKNFILDTNVLLHDPRSLFGFQDNDVIVPIYSIEEIDQFKRDLSELGRNAREVARYLDDLRQNGHLSDGVALPSGGQLRVMLSGRTLPKEMANGHTNDDKILAVALDVRDKNEKTPAVFVTKDTNLRIRADALGLTAVDFDAERVELSELYKGFSEVAVTGQVI